MDYASLMHGYQLGSRVLFIEPPRTPLGSTGNLLARTVGSSLEFMEHREYLPGDDLRRIDWNAFARSDRLALKLFREEVNPHVDLLLDVSRSMSLDGTKKAEATHSLVGYFASAAAESRFSFHLYVTDEGCRRVERSHLTPTEWEPFEMDGVVSPSEAIRRIPPRFRPRGIRILVSDLLFLADPGFLVASLVEDAAIVIVVQLLAKEDAEPPEHGNMRFVDCETGERLELYLDSVARERYKQNLARHQESYDAACRRHGAFMTTLIAETFLEEERIDPLFRSELLRYKG